MRGHVAAAAVGTGYAFWALPRPFAWHPVLMAWAQSGMFAAVHQMQEKRARSMHQRMQVGSVVAAIAGLGVMYTVKESFGKPHWWSSSASVHATVGGLLWVAIATLAAVASWLPWKVQRGMHTALGAAALLAFAVVYCLGLFKAYYAHHYPFFLLASAHTALLAVLTLERTLAPLR